MRYDDFFGLALALFEESCDALFLFDAKVENVLDANAAAQRLSGVSLRELLVASVNDLFQYDGKPGICPIPKSFGTKHGPVELGQCQLRTGEQGVWIPVTLTLTRLLVRPKPLTLLLIRKVTAHTDWDSESRVCDKCGSAIEDEEIESHASESDVEHAAFGSAEVELSNEK